MSIKIFGVSVILFAVNVLAVESPYKGEERRDIKAFDLNKDNYSH